MKKLLLTVAIAVATGFTQLPSVSAQTASLSFTPVNFPSAAPGSTITFAINLTFTTGGNFSNLTGLTYFLQQTGAAPYIFAVVGRDRTGSPFTDPITGDSSFTPGNPDPFNQSQSPPPGSNFFDLGALVAAGPPGNPDQNALSSGTYFVANITLSIASNAPAGVYTVQSVTSGGKRGVINNNNGDTFALDPGSISVTVVPEPSTYALLAMAGIGMVVVAYRRRAMAS